MNWLDGILLLVLLGSVVSSVVKGFSREVIGLVSAFAALIAGVWFYGAAGEHFAPYVSSRGIANLLGFLLVFFGVLVAGSLVGYVAGRVIKTSGLSFADRLLGGLFGLVRGFVVAVAIVMGVVAFGPGQRTDQPPKSVVDSSLAPYVIDTARVLTAMAPRELKDEFSKRYEQVKGIWEESVTRRSRESIKKAI